MPLAKEETTKNKEKQETRALVEGMINELAMFTYSERIRNTWVLCIVFF